MTRVLCPWGFSGQESWSGLPHPPPGDLPDPGMEPTSLASPALHEILYHCATSWSLLKFMSTESVMR